MDDVPICPEWWPRMIWHLHFTPRPKGGWGGGGGNPVNYPPALDHIFSGLLIHTSSYLLQDAEAAKMIRSTAEKTIISMVQSMDKLHDESIQNQMNSFEKK